MSSTIFGPQFHTKDELTENYVQLREVGESNKEQPLAKDFVVLRVCANDMNEILQPF